MTPYKMIMGVGVVVLSLIVFGILWTETLSSPTDETHLIKMDLTIGNYSGINIDTDALHFGTALKGRVSSLAREVVVENNDNVRRKVVIGVSGELAPYIGLSENRFVLDPYTNTTVEVTVIIPSELDYGSYNGTLAITLKR